ncbi:NAD-dependent epimerase/dehydratase family protein [Bdellovibrio bacteriovorus]|uniref:NAD-dependent epimerase/dehydratase family protein n=1 Tax=Bdellovibrio bacteriovorus TaxID=959 RepID=UPI0035A86DFA
MKKIILTGATGFVGSYFQQEYANQYDIIPANLRSTQVTDIPLQGIEGIVHCAALVHQMRGAPKQEYFKINFELTRKLATRAKSSGVKQFVFISTSHVYGTSGNLYDHGERLTEYSKCVPQDAYGQSKLAAENFLLSIQDANFKVSIIRPPMVYGKGAKGNMLNLAKLINHMPFLPLAFTKNRRSIVYIGNLCHVISLVLNQEASGIFLPQDPQLVSTSDLVKLIANALKKGVYLFTLTSLGYGLLFKLFPKISIRLFGTLALDSTETRHRLGEICKFSTQEGLKKMFT